MPYDIVLSNKSSKRVGRGKKSEKYQREHQGQRRMRMMSEQIFTAVWGDPQWSRIFLKDCNPWRIHAEREEKCEKEGATMRNLCTDHKPQPHCASWSRADVHIQLCNTQMGC